MRRYQNNPIVIPGKYPWRRASVFNPGVVHDRGRFYMIERAAGGLDPFKCVFGLLSSEDGFHFEHVVDHPIYTGDDIGLPHASLQDPRLVKIGDMFYMVYAMRPYSYSSRPTGVGLANYFVPDYDGCKVDPAQNVTRSLIAESRDLIHWKNLGFTSEEGVDDRDNVLFSEKIDDRFVMLRRPIVAGKVPQISISYSMDLKTWSPCESLAAPEQAWECKKIGASTPPVKTEAGWLLLYHGVDEKDCYRLGAMLLDEKEPTRVLARTAKPILEPETYYEKVGLLLPNVVFPTGLVLKDHVFYIYYGCCDTCISVCTIGEDEMMDLLKSCSTADGK